MEINLPVDGDVVIYDMLTPINFVPFCLLYDHRDMVSNDVPYMKPDVGIIAWYDRLKDGNKLGYLTYNIRFINHSDTNVDKIRMNCLFIGYNEL